MATRSNIGIRTENGTIIAAYCHWDGYLAYNGQMLFENYTNEEDVLDLVALGSFSSLRHTAEETATDERNVDALTQWEPEVITDRPECIRNFFKNTDREYLYVYDAEEGLWYYAENTYGGDNDGKLKLLFTALEEMELI